MKHDLKDQLISSGLVFEADIKKALDEAEKDKISFQDALVNLELIKMSDLGKSLSVVHGLPYKELTGHTLPKSAENALSAKCAIHWGVCAVDYNPHLNLMTMAVKDAEHAKKMSRIYRFLLDTLDVAFTVAPEPEIMNLVQRKSETKEKVAKPAQVKTLTPIEGKDEEIEPGDDAKLQSWSTAAAKDKKPVTPEPLKLVCDKPADKKVAQSAKTLVLKKENVSQPEVKKPVDEPSEQLLNSLSSAVSMLVTAHLSGKTQELSVTRASARYCQLVAARLNFMTEQTTKLIISAWLSALKDKPEVIRQFSSPYDLEGIIFSKGGADECIEALVLGLVNCYQEIEKNCGKEAQDVNFVRRHLHMDWPQAGAKQDIIETFLQVLMDEQFMNKFDHTAGTILLLDPEGNAVTDLESPLTRAGYNVHIAGGVEEAQSFMYETVPDFIIANATKSEDVILDFCKKSKADDNTSGVPIEVLLPASSKARPADFLRAGADDYLGMPVDVELLYLKIEKQTIAAAARPTGNDEGVTGSLADMSFCDMLQMLNVSCKSMDITVTRGDETGRVILQQGNVIHSELGDIIGENAFYKLMHWADGKFAMKECSTFPEPTVTSSTMSLLMEGARLADEA